MMTNRILLARQPILDLKLAVRGYELLYRHDDSGQSGVDTGLVDGDHASSQVLVAAFSELDINQLIENHPAYINFGRNMLFETLPFAKQRLVIEVLEDIKIDPPLIKRIQELKSQGYTIALDDFVYRQHLDALVQCADIVKVDVLAMNRDQLQQQVDQLKRFGVTLLAEKIEDHDMFNYCCDLGFDLFQGFFFTHPKTISGRKISPRIRSILRLLAELQSPNTEFDKLEQIIANDAILSVKLLKLVNSAAFTGVSEIKSLQQAITRLGVTQIRNWTSLLALAHVEDTPPVIPHSCAFRAKMCELLGGYIAPQHSNTFFTAGLFSGIDALFDLPIEQVLPELHLVDTINKAILDHKGIVGIVLKATIAFEQGRWDSISWSYFENWKMDKALFEQFYLESLAWSGIRV